MANRETKEQSERKRLEAEKVELAKKIGIWQEYKPAEGWEQTVEMKRIHDIDQRLAEIVNG